MQRLHARACKKCEGEQGRLISMQLPTKSGSIGQVTKDITRDLMLSGCGARISTMYGPKETPASYAYNQYATQQLEAARQQQDAVLDNGTIGKQSD